MYIFKIFLLFLGTSSTQLLATTDTSWGKGGLGEWSNLIEGDLGKFLWYSQEYILIVLSFLIPLLMLLIFILCFYEKYPYTKKLFLIKSTIIAILLEWILASPILGWVYIIGWVSIINMNIPFISELMLPLFLYKELDLYKEADVKAYLKNKLPPKDLKSPVHFIFKKSTKETINSKKFWLKIWCFIACLLVFVNFFTYIILFIMIYYIKNIIKEEFYGGVWEISISEKELRWETPPFERSYKVDISDIKYFKIINKINHNSPTDYILETTNNSIYINTNVGIDMWSFEEALVKVGITSLYLEQ